jgi:hypothetical protein
MLIGMLDMALERDITRGDMLGRHSCLANRACCNIANWWRAQLRMALSRERHSSSVFFLLSQGRHYGLRRTLVILFNLIFAQFQIWKADQKTISALSENLSAGRRRRNKNIAKLQEFWVAVGPIITRPLLKDISDDDFNKYHEEANALAIDCTTWIAENMGVPAREKFLDRTGMQGVVLGGVNDTHNYIVKNLTILRQNLQNIIENYDAWDANRE